ncbi:MAG: putative manganese-dependent inorganic diphosphatase [Dorea sp.]|nr:putative manganese-dependent inorganic diphosphatase [Dorea sp.]
MSEDSRTIYVVGHKNPDTDSICSAISYAYLKFVKDSKNNYIPKRAGQISSETEYVLNYFGVEPPTYLDNIGTRVKDMEIRKVQGGSKDMSIKNAWNLLREQNVFTLPILNEDNELEGLITTNDIARSYLEEQSNRIVSQAKTPYRNIVETLEGKLLVGDIDAYFEEGKVIVAAANPDVMEKYIEPHDMIILGNRYESQLCAIEMGASCIIVSLGSEVSKTIQLIAKEHGCSIISTPLETLAVARQINQSMPVDYFMKKERLVTFHQRDYTENIKDIMSSLRHRDFPILDKKNKFVGMISRRNLLGVHQRGIILVDHNEIAQAVDNIMDAEVIEVIDHHKLGSLETVNPIYFRNQPVGCTATIIFEMFNEARIEIPKKIAGLLCAAILSDTLVFRSPTCTMLDQFAAKQLAAIAEIDCEAFAKEMFTAGGDLEGLSAEELFYRDFKKFEMGEQLFGIGQVMSMSEQELTHIKPRMMEYFNKVLGETDIDIIVFLLTNILTESSELLCVGEGVDELIKEAFKVDLVDGAAIAEGIVSRKKQVVPALSKATDRLNDTVEF